MRWCKTLLALTVLAGPAALLAQGDESVEQDLRCAALVAMMAGGAEVDDAELKAGLAASLTYFIGRYEAKSGTNFEDGLTVPIMEQVASDIPGTTAVCQPIMIDLGQRMTNFGNLLQQPDSAQAGSEQAAE